MDAGAHGWLINTATKNYWRVASFYEVEDLIQEGFVCYYKVLNKYGDVKKPQHIMALFKTAFSNRLHDLANSRTKSLNEIPVSCLLGPDTSQYDSILDLLSELPVELTATAPEPVLAVLRLFSCKQALKTLRSKYRWKKEGKGKHLIRETYNERLCRLTGYDPKEVNLHGMLRTYLEEAT